MSRREILPSFKVLNAVSMATSQASAATTINQYDKLSVLLEWSGTAPVGSFDIQIRHLFPNVNTNLSASVTSWQSIGDVVPFAVSGASGSQEFFLTELGFDQMRFVYTATSGTGTLTVTITGQNVGV